MKIGIFGPSSACSPERYLKSLQEAKALSFEIVEGHDPSYFYGKDDYLFACDSVINRVEVLRTLINDQSINLIHAVRGGYGAVDLIPHLIKLKEELQLTPLKRTLFLSGISDVTTILLGLDGITNLKLIHGSGFIDSFHDYNSDQNRKISTDHLLQIVKQKWNGYSNLNLQSISKSDQRVKGKMLGGNLSVLASFLGSPYMPELKNRILFLEEIGEKPYKVDRALKQLKYAGVFDNLKAVLLGDFINCTHPQALGPTTDRVLSEFFGEFNIPVFKGLSAGHANLNLPLPFGEEVALSQNSLQPIS